MPTSRRLRLVRLTRLLAHLLTTWVAAHAVARRLRPAARAPRASRRAPAVARAGGRRRVHGAPAGDPRLLVANHVSWLDTYALHTVEAARFVAKSEVAAWPVVGAIARAFGMIFIKRGCVRSAARTVGALADAALSGRFRGGLPGIHDQRRARPAAVLPRPVPVRGAHRRACSRWRCRYRDAAGRLSTAAPFVGDMSVADSLRLLLREPGLTVDVVFCAPIDPFGLTRRELAARSRAAIAAALGLARQEADPTPLRRAA
ncbi:MAG: lysophospholipid acyltransferase family protein [Candidatus Binatia bacterium]